MKFKKKQLKEIIDDNGNLLNKYNASSTPTSSPDIESQANRTTDYNVDISHQPFRYPFLGRFGFYFYESDGNPHESLIDKLAELEHKQWEKWSKEIAKRENIDEKTIKKWKKYWVDYDELGEKEKDLDREWAIKVINVIGDYINNQAKNEKKNLSESELNNIIEDIVNKKQDNDIIDFSEKKLFKIDNVIIRKKFDDLFSAIKIDEDNNINNIITIIGVLIDSLKGQDISRETRRELTKQLNDLVENKQ
ncbi:MAG: hypothetical protein ACOC33_01205 [bacterium]